MISRAAEGSLHRLGVKSVDLYMVHWPNPAFPIRETMRAMEELVKRGKMKHIGVSNFSLDVLKEAQESLSSQDIVANQVKYQLLDAREIEEVLIPYCKSQKITIVAYSPIKGLAIRKGNDLLEEIASKYGKTRTQVALNFLYFGGKCCCHSKSD